MLRHPLNPKRAKSTTTLSPLPPTCLPPWRIRFRLSSPLHHPVPSVPPSSSQGRLITTDAASDNDPMFAYASPQISLLHHPRPAILTQKGVLEFESLPCRRTNTYRRSDFPSTLRILQPGHFRSSAGSIVLLCSSELTLGVDQADVAGYLDCGCRIVGF